jgi:glucose/arabinose dehydrogenase
MTLRVSVASHHRWFDLPTPARPIVDARDVVVPDSYEVEPILAGLSVPTGLACAEDGTVLIAEGGETRYPVAPSRLLALRPTGTLEEFAVETLGRPSGLAIWQNALYVSVRCNRFTQIVRYDLETKQRTVVVDHLPGDGHPALAGPVFSDDGQMYFAVGALAPQGVMLPGSSTVELAEHPWAQDYPGQMVTLAGNGVNSHDPRRVAPHEVTSSAFKPYGVPGAKGESVQGKLKCSTGIWRSRSDGSELELLAWGVPKPRGLAIDASGDLFVTDNGFDESGQRPAREDPDRIWRIANAREAPVPGKSPDWFGFPDYCGDGLPIWDACHRPGRGPWVEPQLENPPGIAGPAALLFGPATGLAGLDFGRSDEFGFRDDIFLCQRGAVPSSQSNQEKGNARGFQVVRVDPRTSEVEPFMRNRRTGPASQDPGSGGVERPVACRFSPNGRLLYVLDYGVIQPTPGYARSFAHTGMLWRITRREAR